MVRTTMGIVVGGGPAPGINGVIGAGSFALPAVAAARSGNFSPWLFLFCAVLIMTVVLCFSRAASFVSDTGGPIQYAGQAFGPFAGFQTGWLTYIGRLSALAANIKLMVIYAGWFWAPLESGVIHHLAVTSNLVYRCKLPIVKFVQLRSNAVEQVLALLVRQQS